MPDHSRDLQHSVWIGWEGLHIQTGLFWSRTSQQPCGSHRPPVVSRCLSVNGLLCATHPTGLSQFSCIYPLFSSYIYSTLHLPWKTSSYILWYTIHYCPADWVTHQIKLETFKKVVSWLAHLLARTVFGLRISTKLLFLHCVSLLSCLWKIKPWWRLRVHFRHSF